MKARFRFATDILRRLGEELNPSLDHGVIELVKNAHDADATNCLVRLEGVSTPGGTLTVEDNGDGMTAAEIADHFLLLGRSAKGQRRTSREGRPLAGSKGLGRLAALRAGAIASVSTVSVTALGERHTLAIDWAAFDDAATVDAIELDIETEADRGGTSGTTITVQELRRSIGRREVHRLARALLLLADPFGDDPTAFRPALDSEEFKDLAELVQRKYFDDAEYHLHLEVDGNGSAAATVADWRGEVLFQAAHTEIRQSEEPYRCPPAVFDLWVFILNSKTFETRHSTVGEVREWLSEFGGVLLYINGIRVPPYGDPGNDWLDMNLQRGRSPEERPGTNTSLGRIRLTVPPGILDAKTDRSGLIETLEFADLRTAARDGLNWMARERLRVAEQRRSKERTDAPTESEKSRDELREVIAGAGESAPAIQKVFSKYDRAREREIRALREEVQLYRTLSTAGITAATFAHESSGGPLKIIGRAVATVRRRIARYLDPLPEEILEPLGHLETSVVSLGAFSDSTLKLVDRDKRRTGKVLVHAVLASLADVYRPFVEARDAELILQLAPGDPYLRTSVAAIESIVVNLLTNALAAVTRGGGATRIVQISTSVQGEWLELRVTDNGPGLKDFTPREVWLPGVTSRPGGSGLGLTIVRDTASDLGGEVSVERRGSLGGAEFLVRLPVVGT